VISSNAEFISENAILKSFRVCRVVNGAKTVIFGKIPAEKEKDIDSQLDGDEKCFRRIEILQALNVLGLE